MSLTSVIQSAQEYLVPLYFKFNMLKKGCHPLVVLLTVKIVIKTQQSEFDEHSSLDRFCVRLSFHNRCRAFHDGKSILKIFVGGYPKHAFQNGKEHQPLEKELHKLVDDRLLYIYYTHVRTGR